MCDNNHGEKCDIMLAMDAVKKVMELREVRHIDLCNKLDIKSNVLSKRYTQTNVSVSKLKEMLSVLNYKVVIMPVNEALPENSFEIE